MFQSSCTKVTIWISRRTKENVIIVACKATKHSNKHHIPTLLPLYRHFIENILSSISVTKVTHANTDQVSDLLLVDI